jgi:uncharacterized membrane protein (DUF4010 family)
MLQSPTRTLNPGEWLQAALLLLVAAVLWVSLPDQILHEHVPVNPRQVLKLVIILAAIQIMGHVVLRSLGPRLGLSLTGLVSGFVSSTATHAAMGAQARDNAAHSRAFASAAVLSNVATAVQAMLMVGSMAAALWAQFAPYLLAMAGMAVLCGSIAFVRVPDVQPVADPSRFSLRQVLIFAALLTAISAVSAFVLHEWGQTAAWMATGLAAMVDVHVAIATIASQAPQAEAGVTILLLICLTINAMVKTVIAWVSAGPSRFAVEVSAYLALIALAPWVVWLLIH